MQISEHSNVGADSLMDYVLKNSGLYSKVKTTIVYLLCAGFLFPCTVLAGNKNDLYHDTQGRLDSIDQEHIVINDQSFSFAANASFKSENGARLSRSKLNENDEVQCKFSSDGQVDEVILLKKGTGTEKPNVTNRPSNIILNEDGVWKN